jgi:hypothetical protein
MIDILVFGGVCLGLLVAFVLAVEYYWYIGAIGGLFGAVFTLIMYQSGPDLCLRVFLNSSGELVYQTMPLGYFFYAPLILSVLCFSAAVVKKVRQ